MSPQISTSSLIFLALSLCGTNQKFDNCHLFDLFFVIVTNRKTKKFGLRFFSKSPKMLRADFFRPKVSRIRKQVNQFCLQTAKKSPKSKRYRRNLRLKFLDKKDSIKNLFRGFQLRLKENLHSYFSSTILGITLPGWHRNDSDATNWIT